MKVLLLLLTSYSMFGAFSYYRTVTVQSSQVPSTQTNFPMVFAGTYSYLAGTGSGGLVTSASGYDIGFYSSSSCSTGKLDWELESYTAATGAVAFHVEVPSIADGTVIYLCYGDATITTDQSNKTGVWDSNYKIVWHASDNAASTTVLDSTSNTNNGTNAANTSGKTTTAKIGSGLTFNGTSDFITRADSGANVFGITNAYTMSMWVFSTNYAQSTKFFGGIFNSSFADGSFMLRTWSTNGSVELTNYSTSFAQDVLLAFPYFTNSTAYLVHMVYNGSTLAFYGQGASQHSFSDSGSLASLSYPFTIAATADGAQFFTASYFDEIRLSNVARSANWITTEWNNQSAPSSFYSIGSQTASGGPGGATAIRGITKFYGKAGAN